MVSIETLDGTVSATSSALAEAVAAMLEPRPRTQADLLEAIGLDLFDGALVRAGIAAA